MILWYILSQKFHRSKVDCKVLIDYGIIMNYKLIYLCFLHTLLTMTSLAEKRRGSSLSSSLIVDTLLISKLFTPLVPIYSQFRLYNCYLGKFVENETQRFQCFFLCVNEVIIEKVYKNNFNRS